MDTNYKERLADIKCLLFDIDGVLTDGTVYLIQGEQVRRMNMKDGYAIQLAVKKGFIVGIISGGRGTGVKERMEMLGVKPEWINLRVPMKMEKLDEIMDAYDLKASEILYMGDDVPDYDVIQTVGVGTCPANACYDILDIADYVSPRDGGKGAVRDVIEQTLRVQGKWSDSENDKVW